ncbi:MAG: recombination protein RecT [Enterobacterales bacterium]|jgi:recombination protein RecT
MSSTPAKQTTIKDFFSKDAVKSKFEEVLGKKSTGFITSVVQVTAQNKMLATADPNSVYMSAMIAATLDLPINPNLGFAWIIPFKESVNIDGQWTKKSVAQFQMGYKGFIQLSLRTGQYKSLNAIAIDKGHFVSFNPLTEELVLDFDKPETGEVIGYCAYFELINGFKKTVYWSKIKVDAHAKKYSQAYKSEKGKTPWKEADQYDGMALKTVLKNMLSKWGIMSVDMQVAVTVDQAVVKDAETLEVSYPDNETEDQDAKEIKAPTESEYKQILQGVKLGTATFQQTADNFDLTEGQINELQAIELEK